MKINTIQRVAVVQSDTAKEFELDLNKRLSELSIFSPTIEYNMNMGHCAYLTYTFTEEIPENVRDEYDLEGLRYTCADCPELNRTKDKRRKWFNCAHSEYGRAKTDSPACEFFYENLRREEIGKHE